MGGGVNYRLFSSTVLSEGCAGGWQRWWGGVERWAKMSKGSENVQTYSFEISKSGDVIYIIVTTVNTVLHI